MAENPVCPIYYNDLLGSTSDWTDEEFGGYVRLLLRQWDKHSVPSDMNRLKKIADSAEKNWPIWKDKFKEVEPGKLQNERMEIIRERRANFSKMQSEKGKKGGRPGNKKKPKHKPEESRTKSQSKAEKKPKDIEIEIEKEIEKEKERENEIIHPWRTDGFFRIWVLWKRYKKEEHRFYYKSNLTEQAALKKLAELSGGIEETARKILERSIEGGWKGFFELKENGQQTNTPTSRNGTSRLEVSFAALQAKNESAGGGTNDSLSGNTSQ